MITDPAPSFSWHFETPPWQTIRDEIRHQPTVGELELEVFRHGQTSRNAAGRISGLADVGLTEHGARQAVLLGHQLQGHYDIAFHSPLKRSSETLIRSLAASQCRVGHIRADQRLAERSMGDLEGKRAYPLSAYDRGDLHWAPPGGEPYISVTRRILAFLLNLGRWAHGEQEKVRVLISTHVGPMRILFGIVDEIDDPKGVLTSQFDNACIHRRQVRRIAWPPFVNPKLLE